MDRFNSISEKRITAGRTRRLANCLTSANDRATLLCFAQELEEEVARLEREARGSANSAFQAAR